MKFKKKAAFLGIVVLLGLLCAVPAVRDELDWWWAESRDQATDYMGYLDDWPRGRHIAEARQHYEQRTWADTKRAMISEALKKHAASKSDPEAIREKKERKERFFWKQVTVENTVVSYRDYLQHYPGGEFADQARRQIDELARRAASGANQ